MEEWTVVTVIITLVGFIMSIGAIVFKFAKSTTKFELSVDKFTKFIDEQEITNKEVSTKLNDHEIRITKLEDK